MRVPLMNVRGLVLIFCLSAALTLVLVVYWIVRSSSSADKPRVLNLFLITLPTTISAEFALLLTLREVVGAAGIDLDQVAQAPPALWVASLVTLLSPVLFLLAVAGAAPWLANKIRRKGRESTLS